MSIHRIRSKTERARLIKLQQHQTKKILANNFLVFEPTLCSGVNFYDKNCKKQPISRMAAEALGRYEHKWSIVCYIFTRDKKGHNKIHPYEIDVTTPCKHDDIYEQIGKIHWDFVKEYKWQDLIISAGWIAGSLGNIPTDEQAYEIFKDVGVWDELLADWEAKEEGFL